MIYQFQPYRPAPLLKGHLRMGDTNPQGERIEVTSRYFERNGRPWFGIMGEFHFSRYNHQDWRRELAKMKAGGIAVVSTYLFWIHHEEIEGEFDFSGNNNLREFVETCRELGLEVMLRIGPWVHGECRNGGFPDWIYQKTPAQRTNNERYLFYVRRWYQQVYAQVKGLMFHDGGNIIGIQVDNELIGESAHLGTLKAIAQECGFRVPLYTVTGWGGPSGTEMPLDEFVPTFGWYPEGPWEQTLEPLPPREHYFFGTPEEAVGFNGMEVLSESQSSNGCQRCMARYPFATCEQGGGMQNTHHRRPVIHPLDIYALAMVSLGDGVNLLGYFMYHGGTNPIGKLTTMQETTETGYVNDMLVLSYDFQAPLSEYGEVRGQYRLLNQLHLFLQDFGAVLAPMEGCSSTQPVAITDNETLRCRLRTDGNGGFVFVNHYQRLTKLKDLPEVVFETGTVRFPAISVSGNVCFFLPFNMALDNEVLRCATAQPLCRMDNTYFFVAIDGIAPVFHFDDGTVITAKAGRENSYCKGAVRLVVLTPEEAAYARRLSGVLYIGNRCDLYELDGRLCAVQDGDFRYWRWNGTAFEAHETAVPFRPAVLTLTEIEEPFTPPYLRELSLPSFASTLTGAAEEPRKRRWYRVSVSTPEGFVEFTEPCDAEQLYADGTLVADNFYNGSPWRIPAKLLYDKTCYLAQSEMRNDFYREF